MKRCKVCAREFEIEAFRTTVVGLLWPDGRSSWCEECIGEADAMGFERWNLSLTDLKVEICRRVLARARQALATKGVAGARPHQRKGS